MDKHTITLAVTDSSGGYEISPERVPIGVLADFSKEVADFLRGSGRLSEAPSDVSIGKGSLALTVESSVFHPVFQDLKTLDETGDLSKIDSKRKKLVELWQERAKKAADYSVRISSSAIHAALIISRSSNFRDLGKARFVNVERYIRGVIQDLGGSSRTNAHIVLPDGKRYTVKASRKLIEQESVNRVYQEAHMRVRGKLNLDTNELTDVELVSFVEYAPKFDNKDMENLVSNGRKAWADVTDHVDWVRTVRGDH